MSEIKVNKISPRTACGTTTLGDSGDTFTIPAGVSITNNGTASGFGATGAVSWNTTVKTSGFTATAGEGYFVDTTSGAISINLPAGTAGAVVGFKDYANTFDTNAVTLVQNGSDKIGGSTDNATLSTEGLAVTLVFIDSTQGWLVTDNGTQDTASTAAYVTATGGTITECGDYKIHTFTGPGTFCVSNAGNASGSNSVSYLVVAGGGGGGAGAKTSTHGGGGGGGGGYREGKASTDCYSASPLNAPTGLPVSVQGYPITVGAGGTGPVSSPGPSQPGAAGSGANSTFSTIISTGGGGGGNRSPGLCQSGLPGGSGGGAGGHGTNPATLATGNTPPVSPPQGNPGGFSCTPSTNFRAGAGGGGATATGNPATPAPGACGGQAGIAGAGAVGATSSINATPTTRGGGGGGGSTGPSSGISSQTGGAGGSGGGGAGMPYSACASATAGTTNTGGGGGGGTGPFTPGTPSVGAGGNGGSGIVIIRYKFQ